MYFKPKSKLSPIKLLARRYWKAKPLGPDSCYKGAGLKEDLGSPNSALRLPAPLPV